MTSLQNRLILVLASGMVLASYQNCSKIKVVDPAVTSLASKTSAANNDVVVVSDPQGNIMPIEVEHPSAPPIASEPPKDMPPKVDPIANMPTPSPIPGKVPQQLPPEIPPAGGPAKEIPRNTGPIAADLPSRHQEICPMIAGAQKFPNGVEGDHNGDGHHDNGRLHHLENCKMPPIHCDHRIDEFENAIDVDKLKGSNLDISLQIKGKTLIYSSSGSPLPLGSIRLGRSIAQVVLCKVSVDRLEGSDGEVEHHGCHLGSVDKFKGKLHEELDEERDEESSK